MGDIESNIEEEIKRIRESVKCGYLHLSTGFVAEEDVVTETGILVECWNTSCGPQHGCDVYDGGTCKFQSLEVDPNTFYNPNGRE